MGARRNFRRGGRGKTKKHTMKPPPNEKNVAKMPPISQKKIHDFPGGGATALSCPHRAGAMLCNNATHTKMCRKLS